MHLFSEVTLLLQQYTSTVCEYGTLTSLLYLISTIVFMWKKLYNQFFCSQKFTFFLAAAKTTYRSSSKTTKNEQNNIAVTKKPQWWGSVHANLVRWPPKWLRRLTVLTKEHIQTKEGKPNGHEQSFNYQLHLMIKNLLLMIRKPL